MKKLIFPIVFIFMTSAVFCQKNNDIAITSEKYFQKSQKRKGEAWALLLGGFTVLGVAALPAFSWTTTTKPFRTFPTALGASMVAGSIPLFVSSGANRRKSITLSLRQDPIPFISENQPVFNNVSSVSLKIQF